jgi:hypothetical protein
VSTEAVRDRLDGVLVGLQSQVADVAAVARKQAALRVEGRAAEGAVEVTVNARGQLVNVVIDKSYLDEHDFDVGGPCPAGGPSCGAGGWAAGGAEELYESC